MYRLFLYSCLSKNGYISSNGLDDILPSALTREETVGMIFWSSGTITSQITGPSNANISSILVSISSVLLILTNLIPYALAIFFY